MNVFPRLCPPSNNLSEQDGVICARCIVANQKEILYKVDDREQLYNFDRVLPETSTQESVFTTVDNAVDVRCILSGGNVAFLAAGQTGSGKVS